MARYQRFEFLNTPYHISSRVDRREDFYAMMKIGSFY